MLGDQTEFMPATHSVVRPLTSVGEVEDDLRWKNGGVIPGVILAN
jgi:hypothetical protein